VPIHYNTFDIIKQDPDGWAEKVRAETKTAVTVMKPGDTIEI
jgi:L-ascorbate metabolism protein UlaG (beta-lactamase superfamily)